MENEILRFVETLEQKEFSDEQLHLLFEGETNAGGSANPNCVNSTICENTSTCSGSFNSNCVNKDVCAGAGNGICTGGGSGGGTGGGSGANRMGLFGFPGLDL